MCAQRKAPKKVVTEEDLITANLNSFGDDIGTITNRITSMFDVMSHYDPQDIEYKVLQYRIMCSQQAQQNSIDALKGIETKPMPDYWYDMKKAEQRDREHPESFKQVDIVASKKPYFMNYRYPQQKKEYKKYVSCAESKAKRFFHEKLDVVLQTESGEFAEWYYKNSPVSIGDCCMNRICRRIEKEIAAQKNVWKSETKYFDYSIYKKNVMYVPEQYAKIYNLYKDYKKKTVEVVLGDTNRGLGYKAIYEHKKQLAEEFCNDAEFTCFCKSVLCDIMLDITYGECGDMSIVWELCSESIISNLLTASDNRITYFELDPDGDISYAGNQYTKKEVVLDV